MASSDQKLLDNLRKLRPLSIPHRPDDGRLIASLSASKNIVSTDEVITLTLTVSHRSVLVYWNDGDGAFTTLGTYVRQWQAPAQPGISIIRVQVIDSITKQVINLEERIEVVDSPNLPPIITRLESDTYEVGLNDRAALVVEAFDPDGDDSRLRYKWFAEAGLFPTGDTHPALIWESPMLIPGRSIMYSVYVRVTDERGAFVISKPLLINVLDANFDVPPHRMLAPVVTPVTGRTNALDVDWVAPISINGIMAYRMQYRRQREAPYIGPFAITPDSIDSDGIAHFRISSLDEGETYDVEIQAENVEGVSGWSPIGTGTTGGTPAFPPSRPNPPTITSHTDTTRLNVRWVAPADGGANITDYDVQYKRTDDTDWTDWPFDGITTSTIITSLTIDTPYNVRVRAKNIRGVSEWSMAGLGRTSNVLPNNAPTITSFTATPASITTDQTSTLEVIASDADSDPLSYTFSLPGETVGVDHGSLSPTSDRMANKRQYTPPRTPGTYTIQVEVSDGDSEITQPVATVTVTVTLAPANPPGQIFLPIVELHPVSYRKMSVTIDAPSNGGAPILGYELQYSRSPISGGRGNLYTLQIRSSFDFNEETSQGYGEAVIEHDGDSRTDRYWFRARAFNRAGRGPWSGEQLIQLGRSISYTASRRPAPPEPLSEPSIINTQLRVNIFVPDDLDIWGGYDIQYRLLDTDTWTSRNNIRFFQSSYFLLTSLTPNRNYEVRIRYRTTIGTNFVTRSAWSGHVNFSNTLSPPAAVPGAPRVNVTSQPDPTELLVTWDRPSFNGTHIADYDVRYKKSSESSYTDWSFRGRDGPTMITGLDANTGYDVQVRAKNLSGLGAWSSVATGTTSAAVTIVIQPGSRVPDQPIAPLVTAYPYSNESLHVRLYPPLDNGAPITAYQVQYKESDESSYIGISLDANETTTIIKGLTAAGSYDVRVRAVNAMGNSAWSAVTTSEVYRVTNQFGQLVSQPPQMDAPKVITHSDPTKLTIDWIPPPAHSFDRYRISFSTVNLSAHGGGFNSGGRFRRDYIVDGDQTSTVISDLTPNTVYQAAIIGERTRGTSIAYSIPGIGVTGSRSVGGMSGFIGGQQSAPPALPQQQDPATVPVQPTNLLVSPDPNDNNSLLVDVPVPPNGGSPITGYYIRYKRSNAWHTLDLPVLLMYRLGNIVTQVLTPDTDYEVRMIAQSNNEIWCPWWSPIGRGRTNPIIGPPQDNRPPRISSFIANPTSIDTNETSELTVVASDPDNDDLTYSYRVGAGTGGSFVPSNSAGSVSGQTRSIATYNAPSRAGIYTVEVTVSDGSLSDVAYETITVTTPPQPNRPPVISSFIATPSSIDTNKTSSLVVSATDPDNDVLTYSYRVGTGTGASFVQSSSAGILSGKTRNVVTYNAPSTAGTYTVEATVSDGLLSDVAYETITVRTPPQPNRAPVISSFVASPTSIDTNKASSLVVSATDPDGDDLTYAYRVGIGTGASFAQSNSAGSISDQSGNTATYKAPSMAGTYTVEVTVSDGLLSDIEYETITVTTPPQPNRAPVISGFRASSETIEVNEVTSFVVFATDPDGDQLTYTYRVGIGTGASFAVGQSDSVGSIFGQLNNVAAYRAPSMAGVYTVEVTASDGLLSDVAYETITVIENQPPVISSFVAVPTSIDTGGTSGLTVVATDPENDVLSYSYRVGVGTGASFIPSNILGSISGQTRNIATYNAPSRVGTYTIEVTVSDGSLSDVEYVTVTVNDPSPDNTAPRITSFTANPSRITINGDLIPKQSRLIVIATDNETPNQLTYNFPMLVASDGSLADADQDNVKVYSPPSSIDAHNVPPDSVMSFVVGTVTVTDPDGLASSPAAVSIEVIDPPERMAAPTVSKPTQTSLKVDWVAPSNNMGSAVTGYIIQYRRAGTLTPSTTTAGANDLSKTIVEGIQSNATYEVQVAAINQAGTGVYSRTGTVGNTAPNVNLTSDVSRIAFSTGRNAVITRRHAIITANASDDHTAAADLTYDFTVDGGSISTADADGSTLPSNQRRYLPPTLLVDYNVPPSSVTSFDVNVKVTDEGGLSDTVSIPIQVIKPPSRMAVTSSSKSGASNLVVTWAVPNNNGSDIDRYIINYRKRGEISFSEVNVDVPNGGTQPTSRTLNLEAGQNYEIQIRARNAAGEGINSNTERASTEDIPNRPPRIISFVRFPSSITVAGTAALFVVATDPDRDALHYVFDVGVGGSSNFRTAGMDDDYGSISNERVYNPRTNLGDNIVGRQAVYNPPSDPGTYTVRVTVSDGDSNVAMPQAFVNITVTNVPNNPPSVTINVPSAMNGLQRYRITADASDPDSGDTLQIRWESSGGGTFDSITQSASDNSEEFVNHFTAPNVSGTITITATVRDNPGGVTDTDSQSVRVTRAVTCPSSVEPVTCSPVSGQPRQIRVGWSAPTDNGGATITGYNVQYRRGTAPWSTWSTSGLGTSTTINNLTPNTLYQVRVKADNGQSGCAWYTSSCTTEAEANDPPTVSFPSSRLTVNKRGTVRLTPNVSSDVETYSWSAEPSTAAFVDFLGNEGRSFQVWQAPAASGTYVVSVTVADDIGQTASARITLVVPNRVPTVRVSSVPSKVCPGVNVTIDATGNDPDGDTLTYSWNIRNRGSADIQNNGRRLVWTMPTTPGVYIATVTVTDSPDGATAAAHATIRVNASPTVSLSAPRTTVIAGNRIFLTAEFSDPDDDVDDIGRLWVIPFGGGEWVGGDRRVRAGVYQRTWRAPSVKGISILRFVANDGCRSAFNSVIITIPNQAPRPTITPANSVINPNGIVNLTASHNDPDGDDCDYSWSVSPSNAGTLSSSTGSTVRFTPTLVGTATISVTATESSTTESLSGTATARIMVNPSPVSAPPRPVISVADPTLNPGQSTTVSITSPSSGQYDVISWSASGGRISGSGRSVTYTAPTCTEDSPLPVGTGFTITCTLTNQVQGASNLSSSGTAGVTINNVSPVATLTGVPSTVECGGDFTAHLDASDANCDDLTYFWVGQRLTRGVSDQGPEYSDFTAPSSTSDSTAVGNVIGTANDSKGGVVIRQRQVIITPRKPDPPTITLLQYGPKHRPPASVAAAQFTWTLPSNLGCVTDIDEQQSSFLVLDDGSVVFSSSELHSSSVRLRNVLNLQSHYNSVRGTLQYRARVRIKNKITAGNVDYERWSDWRTRTITVNRPPTISNKVGDNVTISYTESLSLFADYDDLDNDSVVPSWAIISGVGSIDVVGSISTLRKRVGTIFTPQTGVTGSVTVRLTIDDRHKHAHEQDPTTTDFVIRVRSQN